MTNLRIAAMLIVLVAFIGLFIIQFVRVPYVGIVAGILVGGGWLIIALGLWLKRRPT